AIWANRRLAASPIRPLVVWSEIIAGMLLRRLRFAASQMRAVHSVALPCSALPARLEKSARSRAAAPNLVFGIGARSIFGAPFSRRKSPLAASACRSTILRPKDATAPAANQLWERQSHVWDA